MATPEERQAYADAEREKLLKQAEAAHGADLTQFGINIDEIAAEVLLAENDKLKKEVAELWRKVNDLKQAVEERDAVIDRQQTELQALRSQSVRNRWDDFDPIWSGKDPG